MSIITRVVGDTAKDSPLTNIEMDNNLILLYNLANSYSTGLSTSPSITDNLDGTVTIGAFSAYLFDNANFQGELVEYSIAGNTFTVPEGVSSYIVVEYNFGSPIASIITDVSLITESSTIPVFTLFRSGTQVCWLSWDKLALGLSNKIHQRLVKTERFARESGLALSEVPERAIVVSSGVCWVGATPYNLNQVSSSDLNKCYLFTKTAGVWSKTAVTQYPNTLYQGATDTATINNNAYGVIYVFRCVAENDVIRLALGTASYNKLIEAKSAAVPSDLPSVFSVNSILIGRIIFQKGATAAESVESAFIESFAFSGVTSHNDLVGIQGGTVDEYYHLTATELSKLTGIEDNATADQTKEDIDSLGIDAATVNGKTVETSVPVGAVFTDTVYDDTDVVKAPGGVLPALDGSNLTNVSTVASINDLTDVDTATTAPNVDEGLVWNGSKWVPGVVTGETLSDFDGGSSSSTYSSADIDLESGGV